jgi:hypothetical protein
VWLLAVLEAAHARAGSAVYSGFFEQVIAAENRLGGWETAGHADVVRQLFSEEDLQRGRVAKLVCTRFVPGEVPVYLVGE